LMSMSAASPHAEPVRALDIKGAVKDAAIAALIGLGLFALLIGFRTEQNMDNQLALAGRPGLLALMIGLIFLTRLAINVFVWRRAARVKSDEKPTPSAFMRTVEAKAGPILLAIALIFPFLMVAISGGLQPSRYWVDIGILILTYIMLGWGLNIVVGLAGLLDLGYVAFYAVGAYTYALIATTLVQMPGLEFLSPWLFWICLPLAGLLAALWGMVLGFPVLRLRGDYLAIVTLAFGEIIRLVLINWVPVTNGGAGISSIPRPSFFGLPFSSGEGGFAATFGLTFDPMHRVLFLYYIILALAVITFFVTIRLRRLPVGRAWEALREDEIACRSLGINTTNTKLTAFSIGAMFGGFAGCFFAARQGFISPESFTFIESAIILAIVVLGGMGSMLGVVVASLVMIGGIEVLRNVTFLQTAFGDDFDPTKYRMLIFGLAMVMIMIWKPRGLISTREPTAFLRERKAISSSLVKEGHG
jgi:branched-chain amino acid transport system permease protein